MPRVDLARRDHLRCILGELGQATGGPGLQDVRVVGRGGSMLASRVLLAARSSFLAALLRQRATQAKPMPARGWEAFLFFNRLLSSRSRETPIFTPHTIFVSQPPPPFPPIVYLRSLPVYFQFSCSPCFFSHISPILCHISPFYSLFYHILYR